MLPFSYTERDYTRGRDVPVDDIRSDLKTHGASVVRLYTDEEAAVYESDMNEIASAIRPDGGTPTTDQATGWDTSASSAA